MNPHYYYKRHHYLRDAAIIVLLIAVGGGTAYYYHPSNNNQASQQTAHQTNRSRSNSRNSHHDHQSNMSIDHKNPVERNRTHAKTKLNIERKTNLNGWHRVSSHKISSNSDWWFHPHYVKLRYPVKAKDMSDKGVPEVKTYSISSKTLPAGQIVKGFFSPTVPGGFAILSGEGVSRNTHYQKSHDAWWNIPSSNTNWISEVKS